ncbi:hypothetical protein K32_03740 [Kaistia sp. 32K]|uniref:hypothetical protein n=1 Tax=Kaistia sp. 32K TaxID=2795690 RepID=UPI001915E6FF|nr:hypothetical protein [Kaistia sp. 32K]BCP51757.1 hypothetical protein K32_03740 [Kaistia sp. 32K]
MPIPKETLADVRRAYRLIWGYQRRIMDILNLMADEFDSHEFYCWKTLDRDPPAKRGTNPLKKWAWDLLPLYQASFLYTSVGSDLGALKAGEWLLEFYVNSDSIDLKRYQPGEPDALKFGSAEKTNSTISLVAWKCTSDTKADWFRDVWSYSGWPTGSDVLQIEDYPVRAVKLEFPIEDLDDKPAIKAAVSDFRALLKAKLEIADPTIAQFDSPR